MIAAPFMLCPHCHRRHVSLAAFKESGGFVRPLGFHPYYCSNCGAECIRFEWANLLAYWSGYRDQVVCVLFIVAVILLTIFFLWACDHIHATPPVKVESVLEAP
jgi:hypothetical protein